MNNNRKTIAVIGGGPGGYAAAIRAAQLGAKATLIEKDRIGGTCLNRGCIPTKALLFDAAMLRSLRCSPVFQSLVHEDFNPFRSMMDRKKKVVEQMVAGVTLLLESHRVTIAHGRADLSGNNQLVLMRQEGGKETIDADAIILATGSKPKVLPDIIPDDEKIITSDGALEIEKVPQEICILGGGYIGLEFATLFNTLGSKVTVVEILDDILPGIETELVRNLRRILKEDGVEVFTKSRVEGIRHEEGRLTMLVRTPQGVKEVMAERVLSAVGRVPNLDLDFSKARIRVSPTGIEVNRRMETTAPHIYAVGDASGGTLLAHVAMEEGMIAAENAMGMDRQMDDRLIPICVFTHPEVATIGFTEEEARQREEIKVGRFPFRSNPKAVISGETKGLVKVVASRQTDEILGVHIIGPEAGNLIAVVSAFMMKGGTAKEFSRLVQAHPTTPEALREGFLDIDGSAIHLLRKLTVHPK